MRIALIAPPWYTIPPSGYGGIEWVVSPLHEEPPRDAIGDPWYEASHVVSVYEHGDEFDILHDHTGPVGVTAGALSNCPTVHTLVAGYERAYERALAGERAGSG